MFGTTTSCQFGISSTIGNKISFNHQIKRYSAYIAPTTPIYLAPLPHRNPFYVVDTLSIENKYSTYLLGGQSRAQPRYKCREKFSG